MTERAAPTTEQPLASVVVLMVDDDEEDIYLTRRAFRDRPRLKAFHNVSGADPLFRYLTRSIDGDPDAPSPDLILLDINMPGRSGFDVLTQLRSDERWRMLPVLVLSTSSSPRDINRAYACGANAFLVKPVTAAGMKEVADRVDSFWFNTSLLPLSGRLNEDGQVELVEN